jgi:hypothetical protein
MFENSLELQKFIFIRELLALQEKFPQSNLKEPLSKSPYLVYYQNVATGKDFGD